MPRITAIKPQKNKPRVNVYIDGKFGFGIDLENYIKLQLKVNQEYSTEKLNEIIKKAEFQKLSDKVINFAMFRPRSEKEVTDWFKRKKVHESLHQDLVAKLKRLDLIDDKKFAKWWIEQRGTFRPRGIRALKAELAQKGVDRKIVDEALNESPVDEVSAAKEIYEKSKYKWQKYDDNTQKQKASEFLARKGFGWEVIKEVLGKLNVED